MTGLAPTASLADRLAQGQGLAVTADITHARRGALRHAFRTRADFVLVAPNSFRAAGLIGRNRFNLVSLHDADHGGTRGHGTGTAWAWQQLASLGLSPQPGLVLALLTQPRFLGYWFNPVSFWMVIRGNDLLAVIAEVNNTFGQRHSYLLAEPDLSPITPQTDLRAGKVFHVSPFQDVAGEYRFGFALSPDRLAIRINQIDGTAGVDTAMQGFILPLTTKAILGSALRRPGGALWVVAQIYWHALRLRLKGARYRRLPAPPEQEISR